jgi:Mg2+/Co2+ transporter CorB
MAYILLCSNLIPSPSGLSSIFLIGVTMKPYLIPIIQTILCLAIWGAIGALLAIGF